MLILVLGATGFIGGAIARRLLERGDTVRVLAHRADADALEALGAEPFHGGLGDPSAMAIAAEGVEFVVNAAGIVSPQAAPRALRWTHVAGTENVVNACKHADVRRLVHISCTDVTLGNVDRVHWDEGRPLPGRPFGERARALQLGEEIAISASCGELEVTALRPAWVWGPGDTSRLPALCREGRSGGIRLVGDGTTFLATTYIDHLVDAAMSALSAPDAVGRTFHVVDPVFQHAREHFGALSEALGLPPPRRGPPFAVSWPIARMAGRAPGGLAPEALLQRGRSTLFDFNIAIGKLSYEPNVTIEQGMEATARWVEAQGGPDAVAQLERPAPDARSVDAQVHAAGGD